MVEARIAVPLSGPKRVNDPGIAFADLPQIDVVLVSHGHYDHLDLTTLSRLAAAHRPRVVTPLGNDTIIRNHDPAIEAETYDWQDQVNIGAGVVATLVATRHWSARNLFDRNMSLWASFVIDAPGGRIYFVADSGYDDGGRFRDARERFHSLANLASANCAGLQPADAPRRG
jgi:L-ascorbate metabolism protein UlaG (beta-lactamase superfamily)